MNSIFIFVALIMLPPIFGANQERRSELNDSIDNAWTLYHSSHITEAKQMMHRLLDMQLNSNLPDPTKIVHSRLSLASMLISRYEFLGAIAQTTAARDLLLQMPNFAAGYSMLWKQFYIVRIEIAEELRDFTEAKVLIAELDSFIAKFPEIAPAVDSSIKQGVCLKRASIALHERRFKDANAIMFDWSPAAIANLDTFLILLGESVRKAYVSAYQNPANKTPLSMPVPNYDALYRIPINLPVVRSVAKSYNDSGKAELAIRILLAYFQITNKPNDYLRDCLVTKELYTMDAMLTFKGESPYKELSWEGVHERLSFLIDHVSRNFPEKSIVQFEAELASLRAAVVFDRYDEARKQASALVSLAAKWKNESRLLALYHFSLSSVFEAEKDIDNAIKEKELAISLLKTCRPANDPLVKAKLSQLASLRIGPRVLK